MSEQFVMNLFVLLFINNSDLTNPIYPIQLKKSDYYAQPIGDECWSFSNKFIVCVTLLSSRRQNYSQILGRRNVNS